MRGNCGGTVGELRGNCCQGTARDRPGKGEAEFATNLNARPRAFPISQCCSTQPGPIPPRLQCSNSNIDCRGEGGRPTQATTQVCWQVAAVCACAGAQDVTSRLSMRLSVWGCGQLGASEDGPNFLTRPALYRARRKVWAHLSGCVACSLLEIEPVAYFCRPRRQQ